MKWQDYTLTAIDTEATGKYPLDGELCEIAAVKWHQGQIISTYQTLLKPSRPMSEEVIKIHNITNEMVECSPRISEKIGEFHQFIKDSVVLAHHAPFDLGFLALEFEKAELPLPTLPVLCTSLISRRAFPQSTNHQLQTLVRYLNITPGSAHRALDDARACLEVGLQCFSKIGTHKTLDDLLAFQETSLLWQDYSLNQLRGHDVFGKVLMATERKVPLQFTYEGGSQPGKPRTVQPVGLVRNPNGDFLVALAEGEIIPKRYFMNKISAATF